MTGRAPRRWLGPLGVRLALSFVAVALAAVVVLAALTAVGARHQVGTLAKRQRQEQARAVAAAAAQAYDAANGWSTADLSAVTALAASAAASVEVRDDAGRLVALPPGADASMSDMMGRMHGSGGGANMVTAPSGPVVTEPVTTGGGVVGTVAVRFPGGLSDAQRSVNDALFGVVLVGAGLAGVLALAVAVFVSKRISRPLEAMTAAAAAMEAGDRGARVAMADAPGELGELAAAFDRMADSVSRHEDLRRALVADVAHELRTPVTILQASCEAFVDGVRAPTVENLSSLHDEVLRLGRLVADLETLSSAEAAGLRLDRRPVDLATVAADAVTSLSAHADAAGVHVDSRLEPVTVNGDAARLHQVVMNLLTNAVKFTPSGGRVEVVVRPDGHLAHLEVADSGPGIAREELPYVFDRFWRGSSAGTTSGSGIGLAVVAELVRAHHGQTHVESAPGQGSRFVVLLPLA